VRVKEREAMGPVGEAPQGQLKYSLNETLGNMPIGYSVSDKLI